MAKYVVFTPEMLQASGDPNMIIDRCGKMFTIVRKRLSEFLPLLYLIETKEKLSYFFRDQLFLSLSDDQAEYQFKERLRQSVYSILGKLSDLKSVSKGIGSYIFSSAK
jgi:hypothetical protein